MTPQVCFGTASKKIKKLSGKRLILVVGRRYGSMNCKNWPGKELDLSEKNQHKMELTVAKNAHGKTSLTEKLKEESNILDKI